MKTYLGTIKKYGESKWMSYEEFEARNDDYAAMKCLEIFHEKGKIELDELVRISICEKILTIPREYKWRYYKGRAIVCGELDTE